MNGIKVIGLGSCVPEKRVTNANFEELIETNDEWIVSHTGIRERRHCVDETHTTLSVTAAKRAMEDAGITPEEIGVCIVSTVAAEWLTPSAAALLQRELGLSEDTICFDLNAACSGFLFALHTAECLLAPCPRKYALVLGTDVLSRFINYEDRGTCILFGDASGAVVVEFSENYPSICASLGSRGNDDVLNIIGIHNDRRPTYLTMKGTAVFKFAVDILPKCLDAVLEKAGKTVDDVDIFAFHQANERIIDTAVKRRKLPSERCYKNIASYGNTSSASIPLLLCELKENKTLSRGNKILAVGFGGGLTWGGAIFEYAYRKGVSV